MPNGKVRPAWGAHDERASATMVKNTIFRVFARDLKGKTERVSARDAVRARGGQCAATASAMRLAGRDCADMGAAATACAASRAQTGAMD